MTTPVLTLADRCDRCSAAALVLFDVKGQPLQLCGHHYHQHEPAIAAQGLEVLCDQREVIADGVPAQDAVQR